MNPGSMEKTVERALEVEISKDSLSFMAWIRIPTDSDSLGVFLKFLNMLGGSGVVATDAERALLKDMRDICEEQQRERAREIELSVAWGVLPRGGSRAWILPSGHIGIGER